MVKEKTEICEWEYDEDHGCYYTSCGNDYGIADEEIDSIISCPYCGKKTKEVPG